MFKKLSTLARRGFTHTSDGTSERGSSLYEELVARRLVYQVSSSPDAFSDYIKTPRTVYCGIDPTSNSLHLGHLVQIQTMYQFLRYGHSVVLLLGGATACIGDPSGRQSERSVLPLEVVENNLADLRTSFLQIFRQLGCTDRLSFVNNHTWYSTLNLLDFFKSVGSHARVNTMLARDSVKSRLEDNMTFAEFSYQLFQAYDFLHLYRNHGCTVQLGGQDQWGNMIAGLDLIQRAAPCEHPAPLILTHPLLLDRQGHKLGKSSTNVSANVWLNKHKTSPYDLYQFFMRMEDSQAESCLYQLTSLPLSDIQQTLQRHQPSPEKRIAQQTLAEHVTRYVHGHQALLDAQQQTSLYYRTATPSTDQDESTLQSPDAAHCTLSHHQWHTLTIIDALIITGLVQSRNEARRLVAANAVTMNGKRMTDPFAFLSAISDTDASRVWLLAIGKKKHAFIKRDSPLSVS